MFQGRGGGVDGEGGKAPCDMAMILFTHTTPMLLHNFNLLRTPFGGLGRFGVGNLVRKITRTGLGKVPVFEYHNYFRASQSVNSRSCTNDRHGRMNMWV